MQPTVTVYRMPRRYQHCFPPLVLIAGEEIIQKLDGWPPVLHMNGHSDRAQY